MNDFSVSERRTCFPSGPRKGALSLARRICRLVSERQRRLRDARHLSHLPDYLLEDVGLERRDLPSPERFW